MRAKMMYKELIALAAMVACVRSLPAPSTEKMELFMPKVQPKTADTYLCTSMEMKDDHRYLTGFEPKANSMVAHHILLYGCTTPGAQPGKVWNCGEMMSTNTDFELGPVCKEGPNIIYAWAMEAPKLNLPKDVGFDVGKGTGIKYLVVQVHYKNVSKFLPPENGTDSSGLTIESTLTQPKKQAGVYLLSTGGYIPAHSTEYFEAACPFLEPSVITPFAYRTHAHSLGRVISGYRVRRGHWEEIGRQDPRLPEMFYNVTTPGLTVTQGDVLAARCTMENTLDHDVQIGATQTDEMCNFYIMFSVERGPSPRRDNCYTEGPPNWYFPNYPDPRINISGIPETASVIPGTNRTLHRTVGGPDVISPGVSDVEVEDLADDLAGGYSLGAQDSAVKLLPDEAMDEMDPVELEYLIKQLVEEEAQNEMRQRVWQQRQYQMWLRQQQRGWGPAV